MGSQAIQGKLWGQQPDDWANIQEATGIAGYQYALNLLKLNADINLLDIGCGSGIFASLAAATGAQVTAIDATAPLIEKAKLRAPGITFLTGEMEELSFGEEAFDIVCGFNSFQYAANVKNALTEAKRVLKPSGKILTMIWGNKADCEAATYLKAVGSLLPPPPPGAGGPFALSENQLLESILNECGFTITSNEDIKSVWDYADTSTALKGLMSVGPVAKAVEHCGFDEVHSTINSAIQPYIQSNGHVVYHNKFRVVVAEK
jgi:ubiquinone/menaquinone biosynthesis C-methylase UbiE